MRRQVPSDRRALARAFLSHGAPSLLLGVHLCGTLSLRCVELYNDCIAARVAARTRLRLCSHSRACAC